MKHKPYIIWIMVNILLPFCPFSLKMLVNYFSLTGFLSFSAVAENTELIFYSLTICIVILNINIDEDKSLFEWIFKMVIGLIAVLNIIILTMAYSKLKLINVERFMYVSVYFPTISAIVYKFIYRNKVE
jgi:hypothetical protein